MSEPLTIPGEMWDELKEQVAVLIGDCDRYRVALEEIFINAQDFHKDETGKARALNVIASTAGAALEITRSRLR